MENYRSGQWTIPSRLFDKLCDLLPSHLEKLFKSKLNYKTGNWGQIIGGNITYGKHQDIFEKGRAIAIAKQKENPKHDFDLDMELTEGLSEFIGCFIGDGFTNNYGGKYVVQFAGDNRFDADYYDGTIIPIARSLFGFDKAGIRRSGNALWVSFYSKRLFEFLTTGFEMPAGLKFNRVRIPVEILESGPEKIIPCIRGMFDTDGCVFYDKRPAYRRPYIRIELTMRNPFLIRQVHYQLKKIEVRSKVLSDETRLQITAREDVKLFLQKIGFSNKRHRNRITRFYPELEKITKAKGS